MHSLSCLLKPHELTIGVLIYLHTSIPTLSSQLKNELTFYLIERTENDETNLQTLIHSNHFHSICSLSSLEEFVKQLHNELSASDKSLLINQLVHLVCVCCMCHKYEELIDDL
jgi:hypothetical protein